jgi:serine/threonine-protein kinase
MGRSTPLIPPPRTDITLGEGRVVRMGPQVGRGSMATVYRAAYETSFGLSRAVAVKAFDVIASDEHDLVLEALSAAAKRAACIRHPNVVQVEDFGMLGPAQPYAIEELVEGHTLADYAARCSRHHERFPLDIALFIGVEVAEALTGARLACSPEGVQLGVVHGELAGSDVLLSWQGEVKVSDFGVAAAARAASTVRSLRSLARRVRSLAPEVARGQLGDARSDVFSLGVLIREMVVGPRFPSFVSDAEAMVWARDGVVHRGMFEPQLPLQLEAILARSLERDPARRYPHAGALGYELRRVALAMGVGDGRAFLRSSMAHVFGERFADQEEVTSEMKLPAPLSSKSVDRFARLRGDEQPEESRKAFDSGTVLVAGASSDDDDEEAGEG